jgi:hypothetical protein
MGCGNVAPAPVRSTPPADADGAALAAPESDVRFVSPPEQASADTAPAAASDRKVDRVTTSS